MRSQEEDVEHRAELVLCEAAKVGGRAFATARSLSAQRGRLNLLLVAHLCRIHGDRVEGEPSGEHISELGNRHFNGGVNINCIFCENLRPFALTKCFNCEQYTLRY